jgi:hypothetical protein
MRLVDAQARQREVEVALAQDGGAARDLLRLVAQLHAVCVAARELGQATALPPERVAALHDLDIMLSAYQDRLAGETERDGGHYDH